MDKFKNEESKKMYEDLSHYFNEAQNVCPPDEFDLRQRRLLEKLAVAVLYILEPEEEEK